MSVPGRQPKIMTHDGTKQNDFEIRPCPVTCAYLEKNDFVKRINEEYESLLAKRRALAHFEQCLSQTALMPNPRGDGRRRALLDSSLLPHAPVRLFIGASSGASQRPRSQL